MREGGRADNGCSVNWAFVYRIVANAACQKLRRGAHQRDEISLDDFLPSFREDGRHAGPISSWSASIDDPAAQTELRAALGAAIGELPATYRAVIVLRDVEGLSMAEMAGSLGITVATAKSRVHRARLFLRQRLAIFMTVKPRPSGLHLKSVRCSPTGSGPQELERGAAERDRHLRAWISAAVRISHA